MDIRNELRIGNYVNVVANVGNLDSVTFTTQEFHPISNHDFVGDDSFEPIPITEDLLLKCGFNKLSGVPFYEIDLGKNIGQIHINPDNGTLFIKHHRNTGISINPMTGDPYFLHQLQNLHYSLSGQEIDVKL